MAAIDGKANATDLREQGDNGPDTSLHVGTDVGTDTSVPPRAPRLGPVKDPCLDVTAFWLDAGGVKRKRDGRDTLE